LKKKIRTRYGMVGGIPEEGGVNHNLGLNDEAQILRRTFRQYNEGWTGLARAVERFVHTD